DELKEPRIKTTIEKFTHTGGTIIIETDDGLKFNPRLNLTSESGFTFLGIEYDAEYSSKAFNVKELSIIILGLTGSLGSESASLKGGLSFDGKGFEIAAGYDGDDVEVETSLKADNVKNTL